MFDEDDDLDIDDDLDSLFDERDDALLRAIWGDDEDDFDDDEDEDFWDDEDSE